MAPTRIYCKSVLKTLAQHTIKGMAHITGGGLSEKHSARVPGERNACSIRPPGVRPSCLPGCSAKAVSPDEMRRTFNCGVGSVLVVGADQAEAVLATLRAEGETLRSSVRSRRGRTDAHQVRYTA